MSEIENETSKNKEDEEEDEEEEENEDDDEEEEEEEKEEENNDNLKNPCSCLRGRKCFFINALEFLKVKHNMDNNQINNSINEMLQLNCINFCETNCQSKFYSLCVEVRDKKTNKFKKQLLTKCKKCFDNTIKTTNKIFKILTDKQG